VACNQERGMSTDYPEDWQEQGWCCRDCGAMAWYTMSPELRALFTETDRGDPT
jgi:hypothetical protein